MIKNMKKVSILIICFLVCLYIAYQMFFAHHFTLENLQANSAYLHDWVFNNYIFSVIMYMLLYFVVVASAIPITAPMSMVGGFLFGVWPTVIYSAVAATSGATLSFFLLQSVSKATIEKRYGVRLEKFRSGVKQYGAWYLLILHFMFLLPFFFINILAVVGGVSLWGFVWSTIIGFLPCAFVYAFAGSQMLLVRSFGDIFSWKIILVIVLLVLVVLLPIMINHYVNYKENRR